MAAQAAGFGGFRSAGTCGAPGTLGAGICANGSESAPVGSIHVPLFAVLKLATAGSEPTTAKSLPSLFGPPCVKSIFPDPPLMLTALEIGRASCRERV